MAAVSHQNGAMSPPATVAGSAAASPPRVVLAGKTGRILCVADIRGDYHELNRLIREHEATAVIHTGDFGFMNADSLDRMGDKILRHLLQYSPLIANGTRQSLLAIPTTSGRQALIEALNNSSIHFPLSQFPHLISGAITFPVPVFTVWGLIEDVRVLEKFRSGEYDVHNLNIIDEATTRVLDVGGLRLRLFGLGGAVALHKMFDNGEGKGTIAGGQGTMWTTALQVGELMDTALRHFDPTETRLFISSASTSRNGVLTQLSAAIKADLTISGGLHFRYPASFNDFSVHADFESYRQKLAQARDVYMGIYASVKERVEPGLNESQKALMKKALDVMQRVPDVDDGAWTNTWHWVLSDASCGHLLFSINEGRVSAETHSQGLNFSHRVGKTVAPPSAPKLLSNPLATPTARPPNSTAPGLLGPGVPARPAAQTASSSGNPSTAAVRPVSTATAQPQAGPVIGSGAVRAPGAVAQNGPTTVRPPGVTATPSARPPMGQQGAIRPPFGGNVNGPHGSNGIHVRPGMMARPPLGPGAASVKSGNAFGTPPAGLARPPQAPRAPRGVSASGAAVQGTQVTGPGQANKVEEAKGRPALNAANSSSTNVSAGAKAQQTPTPAPANGAEQRENRFAPLANVREPREPREPKESKDVKGKDGRDKKDAVVNGAAATEKVKEKEDKPKRGDKADKKEVDKAKDAAASATSGSAVGKGKEDKKDGKTTPAPAATAASGAEEKKDTSSTNDASASATASGAATPDEPKGQQAPVRKPGLYVKSVPLGTTEEDLRGMFTGESKDKIISARVVRGKFQKGDFAYIDFSTDEEATKALGDCSKKIKDTEVSVVISNPPSRGPVPGRGGRGGQSSRSRGGLRAPRTASGTGGDKSPAAAPATPAAK